MEVLQEEEMEKVCNLFRLLAEQSRLKIVLSLMGGELCVYHILHSFQGDTDDTKKPCFPIYIFLK